MTQNFADTLLEAIAKKRSATCVGIDPVFAKLPSEINENPEMNDEADSEVALDAIREFCRRVIGVVAPHVPAVKINAAYFERYYSEGIFAYSELVEEAANLGLVVIGGRNNIDTWQVCLVDDLLDVLMLTVVDCGSRLLKR